MIGLTINKITFETIKYIKYELQCISNEYNHSIPLPSLPRILSNVNKLLFSLLSILFDNVLPGREPDPLPSKLFVDNFRLAVILFVVQIQIQIQIQIKVRN